MYSSLRRAEPGGQRAGERAVRDQSAALLALISDLRAGQRSYVAIGQGQDFWMARVTSSDHGAGKGEGLAGVLRAELRAPPSMWPRWLWRTFPSSTRAPRNT